MARCASRNDGHRLEGGAGGSPGGNCSDAAAVQSETDPDHDRGRERGPIGRGRGRLKNALRWHGLNASTRHLQPDACGAAETLLAAASEHAALVVMGAYGHMPIARIGLRRFTQSVLHRRGAGFDDALMKDRGLRRDRSDSQRCLRRSRSHWHSPSPASRRSRARCRPCAR